MSKGHMQLVIGVVGIALVVALAPATQAIMLLDIGFEESEGYVAGAPLNGQQGWYAHDLNTNPIAPGGTVSTADAHSGSQSFEWSVEAATWVFYTHEFPLLTSGAWTIEYWFKHGETNTNNTNTNHHFFRLGNLQGGTSGTGGWDGDGFITPRGSSDTEDLTGLVPDNYGHQNANATNAWYQKPGITADDEWKGIQLLIDLDANTYGINARSQSESTWTPMASGMPLDATGVSSIGLGSLTLYEIFAAPYGYSGTQPIYIDDIKIFPEPASLALLGLGGLMMLRRRRSA